MSDTYVLVHGAWHTGQELQATAEHMRRAGHVVHCPTLSGNRAGDDRSRIGLLDAAQSLCEYLRQHDLKDVRLMGHSYGGMILAHAADHMPERIRRLVFVNAFVPNPGESLNDMVPPMYVGMFDALAAANNGAVTLPFEVWREAFINDADMALARAAYAQLNPHPYKTFTDKLAMKQPLAALQVGKSYLNCQQDVALPASLPWHPRLSERLGLYRLVETPGSHELLFTHPQRLAEGIIMAGRD